MCNEQQDREEAQREADTYHLFQHPNILHLMAYCLRKWGSKYEAWLLLPFFKVRKALGCGGPLTKNYVSSQRGTLWDETG